MKKVMLTLLLVSMMAVSLTGCGKNKEPETPVVQTPVVTDPAPTPAPVLTELKIGDIVLVKDSNIPYLVVGKNFTDATTATKVDYIATLYSKGVTGDNKFYGFSLDKVSKVLTEAEKADMTALSVNLQPTDDQILNVSIVSSDMDPVKKLELAKKATQYSVYTKTETADGVSVGVKNVSFSTDGKNDTFIFDITFDNKSQKEIIANGRFDITFTNGTTVYECNDGLIDAKDIINFKVLSSTSKSGKIAYQIPAGSGKDLKIVYKSESVPETTWYLYAQNFSTDNGTKK